MISKGGWLAGARVEGTQDLKLNMFYIPVNGKGMGTLKFLLQLWYVAVEGPSWRLGSALPSGEFCGVQTAHQH